MSTTTANNLGTLLRWYVVPWGPADAQQPSNQLAFSLRMLMRAVSAADADADQRALVDWPGFLQEISQVELEVKVSNQTHRMTVNVAGVHADWLKNNGLTAQQATELWFAVVGKLPEGASHVARQPVQSRDQKRKFFKIHCSARLAEHTQDRLAQAFVEAASYNARTKGKRLMPAELLMRAPATGDLKTELRGAAAAYASRLQGGRRYADIVADEKFIAAAADPSAAVLWAQQVLAGQAQAKNAVDNNGQAMTEVEHLPWSPACIQHLLARHSGDFQPNPVGISAVGEAQLDDFAKRFVERRLANESLATDRQRAIAAAKGQADSPKSVLRDPLDWEPIHRRLGAIINHPWLAKVLGLTLDIQLSSAGVPDISTISSMTVTTMTRSGQAAPLKMKLATHMKDGFAMPKPNLSPAKAYIDGVLNVSPSADFVFTPIDVDRTPENYMQTAVSHQSQKEVGSSDKHIAVTVSPQETVGLSLIERGEKRKMALMRPDENHEKEADGVYLEHLIVGYRPDVMSEGAGNWQSLSARRLHQVKLYGKDITHWFSRIANCEAFLQERTRTVAAVDKKHRPTGETHEFLEGELFRWSVWGVGNEPHTQQFKLGHIGKLMGASSEDAYSTKAWDDPGDDPLAITYEPLAPPPQRFGKHYRVGVRLVLADGNSLPVAAAKRVYEKHECSIGEGTSGHWAAPGAPMDRMEPILPPTVLLTKPLQRDRFAKETGRHVVVASSHDSGRRRHSDQRVLVPPRCANIETYILHGALDSWAGQDLPPESAFTHVELTSKGDFPTLEQGGPPSQSGKSDPQATREQIYRKCLFTSHRDVRYLPDPLAKLAVLHFYRAGDEALLAQAEFDYYWGKHHHWPNCKAMHLDVKAVSRTMSRKGIDVHVHDDGVSVGLAPGVHVTLRVWHHADREALRHSGVVAQMAAARPIKLMALSPVLGQRSLTLSDRREHLAGQLLHWGSTDPSPAKLATDDPDIKSSLWMVNPYTELTLLHALDSPRIPPTLVPPAGLPARRFDIVRTPGQSRADLVGHLHLDRATTARVDAIAHWMDNPSAPARPKPGKSYALTPQVCAQTVFALKDVAAVPEDETGDESGSPALRPKEAPLDAFRGLQRLDASMAIRAEDVFAKRPVVPPHDFGDTRARVVDVRLAAVSRDAGEFIKLPETEAIRKSASHPIVLYGSARPLVPVVDYVMPLLYWTADQLPAGLHTRKREAGWFRIWLSRGWYQSGNGELLALLYSDDETHPAVESCITQWGLDPTFTEASEFKRITANALRNRLRCMDDVRQSGGAREALGVDVDHLAASDLEAGGFAPSIDLKDYPEFRLEAGCAVNTVTVKLALYRPLLDPESGRMFVDVHINPGVAYQPFVRLALARYQPLALSALRLSPVVTSEFVQLLPERALSLSIQSVLDGTSNSKRKNARVVLVGVAVPATEKADEVSRHTRFVASVEFQQLGTVPDSLDPLPNGAWIPARNSVEDSPLTFVASRGTWEADIAFDHEISRIYSIRLEEYLDCAVTADDADMVYANPVYFDRIPIHF